MFYIGCPLWSYKEWAGNFLPARTPASDFLRLYSRRLTAVEGNTVFNANPANDIEFIDSTPSEIDTMDLVIEE